MFENHKLQNTNFKEAQKPETTNSKVTTNRPFEFLI